MAHHKRMSPFAVPYLPGEDSASERAFDIEAGYLPVRKPVDGGTEPQDDAHLYFMLHRAMYPQARRKLVFWLNGGPGCSSFDGALLELGALRIQRNGSLALARPGYAWNEYADVVYVDQPVGTGFSYVSNHAYAKTLEQVAKEFVYFLHEFIRAYPAYMNETDVYLAGESLYVARVDNACANDTRWYAVRGNTFRTLHMSCSRIRRTRMEQLQMLWQLWEEEKKRGRCQQHMRKEVVEQCRRRHHHRPFY